MPGKDADIAATNSEVQEKACRNCGTALTGDYCSSCGQNESKPDIHFLDMLGEYLGDVFVWKSGLWKTLTALLFRPGFISKEYFQGRRARYLPPLRLYLVISFLMFLMLSLSSSESTIVISSEPDAELNQLESDRLPMTNPQKSESEVNLDFWEPDKKPQWAWDLEQRLQTNIKSIEEDPRLFLDNFIEKLPYLMFLLLPLFASLIKLTHFFSGYHYLQHLVFSLHYHSALFLLFCFAIALGALTECQIDKWIFLWCIVYLPIALAKAYGSSYASALGKSVIIAVGEAMMLLLTLSVLAIVSLVTL